MNKIQCGDVMKQKGKKEEIGIIICEESPFLRTVFSRMFRIIGVEQELTFEIKEVATVNQLEFACFEKDYQMIFLNHWVGEEETLPIIEELREGGYRGEIILYAEDDKDAIAAFEIEAFDYIIYKKRSFDDTLTTMKKCMVNVIKKQDKILYYRGFSGFKSIFIDDIQYFSIKDRVVTCYVFGI